VTKSAAVYLFPSQQKRGFKFLLQKKAEALLLISACTFYLEEITLMKESTFMQNLSETGTIGKVDGAVQR